MVLSEDGSTIMISSKFKNVWFNILLIDFPIYFSELYAGKIIEILVFKELNYINLFHFFLFGNL